MKVDFEIDTERVLNEVVDRLTQRMSAELSNRIEQAIKGEIVTSLRMEVKEICQRRIPFLTLSDGRTIEEYINDLLSKKAKGDHYDKMQRSKIEGVIDGQIFAHAHQIFAELAKPHIEELKLGILKALAGMLLAKVREGA